MRYIEALKTEKATNPKTAYKIITEEIKRQVPPEVLTELDTSFCIDFKQKVKPEAAHHIETYSSGNEPKIYCYVVTKEGETLFYSRILNNTPSDYAKAATAAGAFLEIYNTYLTINGIF